MARFVVDENMPRTTAAALRTASHEATDVRDVGLRGADDTDVFAYAQSIQAVLVTADRDFASVLTFSLEDTQASSSSEYRIKFRTT